VAHAPKGYTPCADVLARRGKRVRNLQHIQILPVFFLYGLMAKDFSQFKLKSPDPEDLSRGLARSKMVKIDLVPLPEVLIPPGSCLDSSCGLRGVRFPHFSLAQGGALLFLPLAFALG